MTTPPRCRIFENFAHGRGPGFDNTAWTVPRWMRVGDTHDGAMNTILLYLVRNRQASQSTKPEWAYRPMWEITEEALRWRQEFVPDAPRMLSELEALGLVSRGAGDTWRAEDAAMDVIVPAFAERDPATTPAPWDQDDC